MTLSFSGIEFEEWSSHHATSFRYSYNYFRIAPDVVMMIINPDSLDDNGIISGIADDQNAEDVYFEIIWLKYEVQNSKFYYPYRLV